MSAAYYNENDPFAAAWLRSLITGGHISPGDVDERDIRDVRPEDLAGYRQCHFFAGIGGWSYALRLAGWPADRPVWTGSCPCQPFSVAGRGAGFADERHLWPEWFRLIRERCPPVVFGEQVAGRDGLRWFDAVSADMERAGYAIGAADLCAAGVGAPHIRQRLYFGAHRMADAGGLGRQRGRAGEEDRRATLAATERPGDVGGMADADRRGSSARSEAAEAARHGYSPLADGRRDWPGPTDGYWRDPDWLFCRDGKRRPVEPGTFPLADGIPGRMGRLRGYGNAIVPQVAARFVEAFAEAVTADDEPQALDLFEWDALETAK